ncbi:MerR HTH family regulatory protein [Frankia sp. EI5c]|uniref:chaperone modulator CbpM n=1 Tax=Frankia sp. EI5c TaxID=683316 RepID=UPI0007C1FC67|nr:chaperone modulator CbpM [Frankia sp. EI5c]OAA25844.1 MerR HTH family regulatory protein [Frankia sp. EI5c]
MTALVVRARPGRALDIEAFCAVTRLHPDLVRRLVALGLLEADVDAAGRYVLTARAVARAGRIERLRRDLGITYTATGIVLDLLDRIDDLERLLRARPATGEVHPWT